MADPVDTNVIIRFLVEDPETVHPAFRGVFSFFEKLERGERSALLTPIVLFQSYFVLTSYYRVPRAEAAAKLGELLSFRGLTVPEKAILRMCLDTLAERSVDLVDAYLAALCARRQLKGVYSFDDGLAKLGVELLPVD
ncbi:MAG: PIN domain-containing protein [Gemmatimonadetes bacterium]|nr:PIN domain-containing protein [Gemmatimonadota bacterium]